MKEKQKKLMEMIQDFTELSSEDQVYVSGIIKGIAIQKDTNLKNSILNA